MISVYILVINSMATIYRANIFSLVFDTDYVVFHCVCTEAFVFKLSVLASRFHVLVRKSFPEPRLYPLTFSSTIFMILFFTFTSVIYLEF